MMPSDGTIPQNERQQCGRDSQSGLHGRFDDSARPHLRPEYVDLALDIATISP